MTAILSRGIRCAVAAALLAGAATLAGCVSHRDDYGGSNDIGYKPLYGGYNGSFDGTVNSGWGYAGMPGNYGPVAVVVGGPL
jgi:hypothetical protein